MEFLEHFAHIPYGVYICFLLAPFVQEDAAVLGAASTSALGMSDSGLLFLAVLVGLTLSDVWKYWAGRAALTQKWAKKYAEKPRVLAAKNKVITRLGKALMVVRFVPGTRIPFYVAAGYFNAPFGKFTAFIVLSGFVYIALVFALFHALGAVLGEAVKAWLPIIAIGLVAIVVVAQWVRARLKPL